MNWGIALSNSVPKKIRIFDITLRNNEQTFGIFLTSEKKLRIAESLNKLGVDVTEDGFAAASGGEVYSFAKEVKGVRAHTQLTEVS